MDEDKDRQTLRTSSEKDATSKLSQTEQYKVEFTVYYDEFCKRIRTYNGNMTKSYPLIWKRFTKRNAK